MAPALLEAPAKAYAFNEIFQTPGFTYTSGNIVYSDFTYSFENGATFDPAAFFGFANTPADQSSFYANQLALNESHIVGGLAPKFNYSYKVSITAPNRITKFSTELASTLAGFNMAMKALEDGLTPPNTITATFAPLQSPVSHTYLSPRSGPIIFRGSIIAMQGRVDSFADIVYQSQNTTRVPGPLPVLAAGAAFGFSRKLRQRIKSKPSA